jgi:demethylmenaquinone methyltransferase / 2-methoxy-6-polyprenyl-1,4-benzoquinol methylase
MKKDSSVVSHMFDQIASKYDRTNRLLSFGLDKSWRRALCKKLPQDRTFSLIDLATGTGDQILFLLQLGAQIKQAVGIDISQEMLNVGNEKIKKSPFSGIIELQKASALHIPFSDESFDIATVSFGVRNFENLDKGLREMHRVLKQGGKALILEFSLPHNPIIKRSSLLYLNFILPLYGRLLTSHPSAYRYLSQTIQSFPYGKDFLVCMERAGFQNSSAFPLSLGMVTLYTGTK